MSDVWRIANGTNDGDNVEADRLSYVLVLHIVIDRLLEILQLVEVDRLFWFSENATLTGLHFHEHYDVAISGNDIDVTPS